MENIKETIIFLSLIILELELLFDNIDSISINEEQDILEIKENHPIFETINEIENQLYELDPLNGSFQFINNREAYCDLELPCSKKEIKEQIKYSLNYWKNELKTKSLMSLSEEII